MIAVRLSRGLRLLVGLGLLAGACSRHPAAGTAPAQGPSPSPPSATSTSVAIPSALSTGSAATAPVPATSPSTRPSPVPTPARPSPPPVTAPAGVPVSLPRLGAYVYDLSGTTQSPLLAIPQSYQPGATLSVNFSRETPQAGGTLVVGVAMTSQDQVQTTTNWIYGPGRITLTFSNLTFLGLASYDCTYSPPPGILPSPVLVGTLPRQTWSGTQCSGTIDVSVLDSETVTAAGQSWNVWRVHTVLHFVAQSSADVTADSTSLFSSQLGTLVTSDSTTKGTVAGSAFTTHQVTTLQSRP